MRVQGGLLLKCDGESISTANQCTCCHPEYAPECFNALTWPCADLTDEVARELEKGQGVQNGKLRDYLEEASGCSVVVGGELLARNEFDIRLSAAAYLTAKLRARVFEKLEFTVSAGVLLPCVEV
jgi:hypothetical protein